MKEIEKQDYSEIIEGSAHLLSILHNKTLFITGATGFIGSSFIKTILYYNSKTEANVKIVALVRNITKAEKLFSNFSSENIFLVQGSVENLPNITFNIDYIIHGASITSSKDFVEKPVDTILTNLKGTENILNLAKEKNVKSVLYLSTMEVYGAINSKDKKISESDYGYIDVLSSRSSYPLSKQVAENMCVAYAEQYNVNICIARLAQTIGASINYNDSRAPAQFARASIEQKDIELHTLGDSKRNIIYITDAISAILVLLINGESKKAYSIAQSKEVLSILETAEMVANLISNKKIKVKINIAKNNIYPPSSNLQLDTSAIEKLNWQAKIGIEEAYRRMIKGMME